MRQNLNEIKIVFLVSRGRSGSTLLQSILDAHPNICAPIEAKFVLHLFTKYNKIIDWNNKQIQSFVKDIYTNRKFRLFWNVQPKELKSLFAKYQINSFSDACKIIYLSHHSMFPKENIKLIVDKNPLNSRFIPKLLKVFPEARFIHLIRDPRAATFSHVKANMQQNIPQMAYEWSSLNKSIEESKKERPHFFCTVKYEDLAENPKTKFKEIFNFIQVPFYEDLLSANITIKKKYGSNKYLSLPHHKNITNPINTSKINTWKKEMLKKDIEIVNVVCENFLIQYGYMYNKIDLKLSQKTVQFIGKISANFKIWILFFLFKIPFKARVFLYGIVSLIRDRRYMD